MFSKYWSKLVFILLNQQHAGNESTAGLFVLLNRKHAGNKSTAGLFVLLNRKHAGSKSTAELTDSDNKLTSSKQGRRINATKFAIVRNSYPL